MACPIQRTLRLSFTEPTPRPVSYVATWRVGTTGPVTRVPISGPGSTLAGIPACETITGTVEANCSSGTFTVSSFTALPIASTACGQTAQGSSSANAAFSFPDTLLNLSSTTDLVTLNLSATGRSMTFTLSNSAGTDIFSGVSVIAGGSTTRTISRSNDGGDGKWYVLKVRMSELNSTVAGSWNAVVNCTAPAPSPIYALSALDPTTQNPVSSVNEGQSVIIRLTVINPISTTVGYTVTGIAAADLDTGSAALSGNYTLDANGKADLRFNFKADALTEGDETLTLTIPPGNTISVLVKDTSTTVVTPPPQTTCTLTATISNVTAYGFRVLVRQNNTVITDYAISVKASGDSTERYLGTEMDTVYFQPVQNGQPQQYTVTINKASCGSIQQTFTATSPAVPPLSGCDVVLVKDNTVYRYENGTVSDPLFISASSYGDFTLTDTKGYGLRYDDKLDVFGIQSGRLFFERTVNIGITGVGMGTHPDGTLYIMNGSQVYKVDPAANFAVTTVVNMTNFSCQGDIIYNTARQTWFASVTTPAPDLVSTLIEFRTTSSVPVRSVPIRTVVNGEQTALGGVFGLWQQNDAFYVITNTGKVYTLDLNTGLCTLQQSSLSGSGWYGAAQRGSCFAINPTPPVSNMTYYNVTRCGTSLTGVLLFQGANTLTAGTVVKSTNDLCYTINSVNLAASSSTEGTYVQVFSDCAACLATSPLDRYYELAGCQQAEYAYTTLEPTLTTQRYVLPSATPVFYTYTGSFLDSTTPPSGYNASIQRTTQTGCA